MASRPLKGFQCITDGFAYSPTDVLRLKKNNPNFKKPGLKVLSNLETINKNFYVETTSLGDIDWKLLFSTNSLNENSFYQNLDQKVEEYLADFWSSYDLSIPYKVEHKLENTGVKIVYFKRAHYAILRLDGSILYKFRGLHETEGEAENPTFFKLSKALLTDDFDFQLDNQNTVFKTMELNTINDYFQSKKKIETGKVDETELLIPGFPHISKKIFK